MFLRSRNPLPTFLLNYYVCVTSKSKVNFWVTRYWWFCLIDFLKFLHCLCFWGRGIHCWYSYQAILFGWPRKSRSTSGSGGSQRYWWLCLMDFCNIFKIYVFKVRESFLTGLLGYNAWGPRKSKTTSGYEGFEVILMYRELSEIFEVAQTWQISRNASNE